MIKIIKMYVIIIYVNHLHQSENIPNLTKYLYLQAEEKYGVEGLKKKISDREKRESNKRKREQEVFTIIWTVEFGIK